MKQRHTISVLLENKSGALARIAGLFCGRGYNIESLTVGPTQDSSYSMMTIVTSGDDNVLEQIDKQLNKLVNVVQVVDLTQQGFVSRELMIIKVKADQGSRHEIFEITNVFKANVIHIDHDVVVIEVTGRSEKLDAFIDLMTPFGIVELARTGKVALARSAAQTAPIEG
jgi:acetolactate synthase-1/3 small subunit